MAKKKKTEHVGGKNGGGFWGTRDEAKTISKSQRRINGKEEVKKELKNMREVLHELLDADLILRKRLLKKRS